MRGRDRIEYKSVEQVRLMRRAGLVVADALDAVRAALRPGVTTKELDAIAEDVIRSAGAIPSFLGYAQPPYPASTCISVNDEVVHGIPGPRVIQVGELVSVDCGAIVAGWHGDAAFSAVVPGSAGAVAPGSAGEAVPGSAGEAVPGSAGEAVPGSAGAAGEAGEAGAALSRVTEDALWRGIAAFATGDRLFQIGTAIEEFVGQTYGLVEDYGGHGIGTAMHQDPHVLNYRTRDRGPRLRAGMCLAIEPMLTAGRPATRVAADHWTVVTADGGKAAHWEHTSARHEGGIWVLTARDGGAEALAALGITVAPLAD